MLDYKTMYCTLFKAVTESIEILKQAQILTEEMYISSSEKEDDKIREFKIVNNEIKNTEDKIKEYNRITIGDAKI